MPKFNSPLDNVQVAAPCSANWEEMNGDDRARHCGECQLNVYNLSEMTRREAEKLLIEREGSLCVRFYRRADGTIITENCPRGVAAIKRRLSRTATALVSAVFTFLSGIGIYSAVSFTQPRQVVPGQMSLLPIEREKPQINENLNHPGYETVMGNVALPVQGRAVINKSEKQRSDR